METLSPGLVLIWIAEDLDKVTYLTTSNILPEFMHQYMGKTFKGKNDVSLFRFICGNRIPSALYHATQYQMRLDLLPKWPGGQLPTYNFPKEWK